MRMRLFIAASILLATGTVLAQAYRWVDENGIVHYSDRPVPGAERIELPRDTRTASQRRVAAAAPAQSARDQLAAAPAFKYESLAIASPEPEETLWNIEGVLNVTLALRPALQDGHQVRVYFDGKRQTVGSASFQIQEVWRGVHNLQAEVVDAKGKLMIRSVTNRFYVQQNTISARPAHN
jgi:hypothetical protein